MIREAVLSMCERLISLFPMSDAILQICLSLIGFSFEREIDYDHLELWFSVLKISNFTDRADAVQNTQNFLFQNYEAMLSVNSELNLSLSYQII
jgi:hypothetical protein